MKTHRRTFLGSLLAFVAIPEVARDKVVLWNPHPRQKEFLYSRDMRIPLTGGYRSGASDVLELELERVRGALPTLFERDDHLFAAIENVGTREQTGTRRRGHGRGRSQRGRRG